MSFIMYNYPGFFLLPAVYLDKKLPPLPKVDVLFGVSISFAA